jgi:hypothetical protein
LGLTDVLVHGNRIGRRDYYQIKRFTLPFCELYLRRMAHRPWVEAGDLVVVQICGRKEGCRKFILNYLNTTGIHAMAFQPAPVV